MPGIWQCWNCKRRWAWNTHTNDPCPDCGCRDGTELDLSGEARRKRVAALLANAGDTVLISVADLRAMMERDE